jgi:hypothetical protein
MAKTEKAKGAGKTPPKPDEKPGPETVDAPFDEIMDAILGADPEAVREYKKRRSSKRTHR